MILKCNNRFFKVNSKILQVSDTIDLDIFAGKFPFSIGKNQGSVQFLFSSPTNVIIDWGDGNVITYPTRQNYVWLMDWYLPIPATCYSPYIYPDGLNKNRRVRISFDKALLVGIRVTFTSGLLNQPARFKFNDTININELQLISTNFSDIDDSFIQAKSLKKINLVNAFTNGSRFSGSIPTKILNSNIQDLGYGDSSFGSKSYSETNLDKIILLKDNLIKLSLTSSQLKDLPDNLSELKKLDELSLAGNLLETVPSVVNLIPSIRILGLRNNARLITLGDFRNLINLISLDLAVTTSLEVSLPNWFNQLINLKRINYIGSAIQAGKLDLWVSEIYNFIVNNAAIAGVSTDKFRSMNLSIGENVVGDGVPVPSGVYRKPSDYLQGISNGSPLTSLEKIWVLVNQYGHNITYRAI